MASFSQYPPCFSISTPINHKLQSFSHNLSHPNNYFLFLNSTNTIRISCSNSENNPPQETSSSSSQDSQDPVKLAFAKAKAYKNSLNPDTSSPPKPVQNRTQEPYDDEVSLKSGDDEKEAPLYVKIALEKANEYEKSKNIATSSDDGDLKSSEVGNDVEEKEVPLALKLALEKAKEYKKNKAGDVGSDSKDRVVGSETVTSVPQAGNKKNPEYKQSLESLGKNEELKISNIDFVGLNFADKKSGRGLPAGLVPISDSFPEGELPEVEIIVGDKSKFGKPLEKSDTIIRDEDDADALYKPRVSTWGVFPRPNDISKAYGGGRNIRPGQALETAEEKAAKETRTKQLVAAYKSKVGMNIDPKLKSECEKVLKDGDSLMELGQLKEAIPFYEKVMEKLAFQSELHGLAALQWSICQDSLSRSNEARIMYDKLQSHPSPQVSKKAKQFYFSFQAMEMMKVTSSKRSPRSTGYQNYFDAFLRDKTNYSSGEDEQDESALSQALPYFIFLVSPIFVVLLIAATKP